MAEYLSLHALLDELNPALQNYFPGARERKIEEQERLSYIFV